MAQEGFDIDPFGNRYAIEPTRSSLGLQPPSDAFTLDTRPYDQMQATPRGFISGLFSDVLGGTLNMPSLPRTGIPSLDLFYMNRNPIMNMMGVGDVQKTAERISYGEPLTTGSGMTLKPREETMFAGMAVAPFAPAAGRLTARAIRATDGLPVGMGIKPINLNKGIYKPELTMEEMLKVKDIPTVDRVRQSIDLVGEKEFENMVNAQFKKYKPTNPETEAMLVESVTLNILGKAQRSPYPQQAALDLAQQRAALPVEQGGLGLPANNTPMDRARALGYPMGYKFNEPSYEMGHSPIGITNTLEKPSSPRKKAEIIKAELEQLGIPVIGETAGTGSTYLKILGTPYKIAPEYGGGQAVPIETIRFSTHSKREFGKPTNAPDDAFIADVFPKGGNTLDEAREAIKKLIEEGGVRSRFAAFDPFRKDVATATAMGVALPDLLAQPVRQYELPQDTIPMYTDPFGNTIGSSIR